MSTDAEPQQPPSAAASRPPALATSAWLSLFVMFRRVLRPEAMRASRDDHLTYMIEQERAGTLFLSGPLAATQDPTVPNGMSVFRVATIEEARRIAEGDPYVQRGIMSFTLAEWTAVEGCLTISVALSDCVARIG